MTPEELLKPRYKVIADYFFNPHKIGDIITLPENNRSVHLTTTKHTDEFGERASQEEHYAPKVIEQYPHLFKKLEWWEGRNPEDMPRYLKGSDGKVRRLKSFCEGLNDNGIVHLYDLPGEIEYDESVSVEARERGYELYDIEEWEPATEIEYNSYINKNIP